jgi:hypothetical protein
MLLFYRRLMGTALGGAGDPTLDPPVNTVAPAVTGTETEGSTLTTTNGTWTGTPVIAYTYQWMHSVTSGGVPTTSGGEYVGVPIAGATSSTYVLQASDVAELIFCEVTATDAVGSASKTSNVTGSIGASGGTWTPADLPAGVLKGWYELDNAGVTTSGGNVTGVPDLSGTGNHLVNNGTVPFTATSAYNSKPAANLAVANGAALKRVGFDWGGDVTDSTFTGWMFVVGRMNNASADYAGLVCYGTTGNDYNGAGNFASSRESNTAAIRFDAAGTGTMINAASVGANHVFETELYFDGSSHGNQYIDNVVGTGALTNCPNLTDGGTLVIGNRFISGAVDTTGSFDGPIVAVLIGRSILDTATRDNIYNYLIGKYGT